MSLEQLFPSTSNTYDFSMFPQFAPSDGKFEEYTKVFIFDLNEITMLCNKQIIKNKQENQDARMMSEDLEKLLEENSLKNCDNREKSISNISDVVSDGSYEAAVVVAKFAALRQMYGGSLVEFEERILKITERIEGLKCFADRWETAKECLELVNRKNWDSATQRYGNVVIAEDGVAHGAVQLIVSSLASHIPLGNIYSTARKSHEEIFNIIKQRFGEKCQFAIISSKEEALNAAAKLDITDIRIDSKEDFEDFHDKLHYWLFPNEDQDQDEEDKKPEITEEKPKPIPNQLETQNIVKEDCPDEVPIQEPPKKKRRREESPPNEELDRFYPIPGKDARFFKPAAEIQAILERKNKLLERKLIRQARNKAVSTLLGKGAVTRRQKANAERGAVENQAEPTPKPLEEEVRAPVNCRKLAKTRTGRAPVSNKSTSQTPHTEEQPQIPTPENGLEQSTSTEFQVVDSTREEEIEAEPVTAVSEVPPIANSVPDRKAATRRKTSKANAKRGAVGNQAESTPKPLEKEVQAPMKNRKLAKTRTGRAQVSNKSTSPKPHAEEQPQVPTPGISRNTEPEQSTSTEFQVESMREQIEAEPVTTESEVPPTANSVPDRKAVTRRKATKANAKRGAVENRAEPTPKPLEKEVRAPVKRRRLAKTRTGRAQVSNQSTSSTPHAEEQPQMPTPENGLEQSTSTESQVESTREEIEVEPVTAESEVQLIANSVPNREEDQIQSQTPMLSQEGTSEKLSTSQQQPQPAQFTSTLSSVRRVVRVVKFWRRGANPSNQNGDSAVLYPRPKSPTMERVPRSYVAPRVDNDGVLYHVPIFQGYIRQKPPRRKRMYFKNKFLEQSATLPPPPDQGEPNVAEHEVQQRTNPGHAQTNPQQEILIAQDGEQIERAEQPGRLEDQPVGNWILDRAIEKLANYPPRLQNSVLQVLIQPKEREIQHQQLRESQKIINSRPNVQLIRQQELEQTCRQIKATVLLLKSLNRRHTDELENSFHEDRYEASLLNTGKHATLAEFRRDRVEVEKLRLATVEEINLTKEKLEALEEKKKSLMAAIPNLLPTPPPADP